MAHMSEPEPDKILELARQRITDRRSAEYQELIAATAQHERPWQFIFLGLVATLLLGFLFWPGPSLDWKLYAAVHGLVAQKHLVSLEQMALPVCARNIGIYGSFALSLGYLLLRGRARATGLPTRPLLITLGLFILLMLGDGINSVLEDSGRSYFYLPRNDLRTITGALFGVALTPIILLVFNQSLRADADPTQPVLTWGDLGWLLILNGLLLLAVYSNSSLLYWPLALFSVISLVGELFTIVTMVIAASMGYRQRTTALRQLARPACLALIVTVGFVSLLALIRFSGTTL